MAEQAAVNREVASSTLAGAAIYCRVDELVESPVSETGICRFKPYLGSQSLPCGVTGNIPTFEVEDSRFKPWQGSQIILL